MAKLDTQNSIVDYLKSQGQDSSYSARKKLATELGITNYSGSDTQNIQLLNTLKSGNATTNNTNKSNNNGGASNTNNTPTTTNTAADDAKSTVLGVDKSTQDRMDSTFEQSQESKDRDAKASAGLSNLEALVGKDQIISDSVWSSINSSFSVPSAVREADAYLAEQLEKIQSGRTSWTDDVRAMIDKIMNREKFSYDVDTDPLFQQALASAMNSGKQAMQDTIGQASALTGGYGSTYATTAGNQAYNSFIEDAYDNLPQYYQMALEAYQMEGDEMYRQYSMLSAEDDKEFNRNVTAYDATYQHRNRMYDEAYTQYRDSISDAFATANLQISEHGQLVSDAYNYYNAASNYADSLYEREYNKWSDDVSLAYKYAEMLNSDYWNESNQTFQATENQKERDWKSAEAEKERAFTASENAKNRAAQVSKQKAKTESAAGSKSPTTAQINGAKKAFETQGIEGYVDYLEALPETVNVNELDAIVGAESNLGLYYNTYTKTKETFNGGFNWFGDWNVDNNDEVQDQNGKTYKLKDLPEDVQMILTKASKGDTYEWDSDERKWVKR